MSSFHAKDMETMKGPSEVVHSHNSIELANAVAVGEKDGTHGDENDMDRMGKIQVLRVCWNKVLQRFSGQLTIIISGNFNSYPSSALL
jgi:hypothetical protein